MIEIDGSFGEGGGQIVRTAVAFSAVTGKPVRIENIRADRPNPGLSPQHVKAILALAEICDARVEGAKPRSLEITFRPGKIKGGSYEIDIGTAGSVTLLIQCLLPALIHADNPSVLKIRGGTDVKWSPSIDYLYQVALPAFALFGVKADIELIQRGYYPRGGGVVVLRATPGKLKSANIDIIAKNVEGVSHCSNLPDHVAKRQRKAAIQVLEEKGHKVSIETEVLKLPSTGSGITLWSGHKGASFLGERGLPAENVGDSAAKEMVLDLDSKATVDAHLADQLIPYLALAGGKYTACILSQHAKTNIWTVSQFLDVEISTTEGDVVTVQANI